MPQKKQSMPGSNKRRLARECAKLDPEYEKAMAEEGMAEDSLAWPEFQLDVLTS